MTSRGDFKRLSVIRQRQAAALLAAGQHAGAYYLLGYAVECALKACIAKQFLRHTAPDRKLMQGFYTHDLDQLLTLAQLRDDLLVGATYVENWRLVKARSEQVRYNVSIKEANCTRPAPTEAMGCCRGYGNAGN